MAVLVVEDDDINYLFLETVLSRNKIKTIRALNGIEAIELCNTNPNIKLVLMDIKMPFMNGYDATRRIKQINPNLPIIAQTAYAMHKDRNKALEAGCDGYISKPIVTSELLKLIEEFSGHK
jgi:CheY-like chemotaxis protein